VVLKSLEVIISKNLICHDNNNKLNIAHCLLQIGDLVQIGDPYP